MNIQSKPTNKNYRKAWERIWGKNKNTTTNPHNHTATTPTLDSSQKP